MTVFAFVLLSWMNFLSANDLQRHVNFSNKHVRLYFKTLGGKNKHKSIRALNRDNNLKAIGKWLYLLAICSDTLENRKTVSLDWAEHDS